MKSENLGNKFNFFNQNKDYNFYNFEFDNYNNIYNGNMNINLDQKNSFYNNNNIILNNKIEMKNLNEINNIEINNNEQKENKKQFNIISFLPKANDEKLEEHSYKDYNQSLYSTKISE